MQQTQQTTAPVQNSFWAGFHDGVPIGLGYLSVSVTFGMMAVTGGLPVWAAVAISMTNVTSAGQFAGLSLIFGGGTLFETALTQFVINLRYALMSLSLSQKLERRVSLIDRMLFSFMMTDEVFAVASGQKGEVGKRYLFGVMIAPYCGWALGTLCGAVASGFLPPSVRSALSIAIYGMFIAIVVPPMMARVWAPGSQRDTYWAAVWHSSRLRSSSSATAPAWITTCSTRSSRESWAAIRPVPVRERIIGPRDSSPRSPACVARIPS